MKKVVLAVLLSVAFIAVPSAGAAKTITIGVLTDFSGPNSSQDGQGTVVVTEMAIEEFKKANPGADLDIKIVKADMGLKADVAVSIAKKWHAEGVNAILGMPWSGAALAVNAALKETDTALLITGAAHVDLVTKHCATNQVHWTWDQYSISAPAARAMSEKPGLKWFFITVDAAGGIAVEDVARKIIAEKGGTVVGFERNPFNCADFSSIVLKARASGADIVALTQGGSDMVNLIKQAKEFGLGQDGKQKILLLWITIPDIKGAGLDATQGLRFTAAFYWDTNDDTRAFSERFAKRFDGKKPSAMNAGAYSALTHYLKAVAASNATDAKTVVAKMKELPIKDQAFGESVLRPDGRLVHTHVFCEVKKPSESKGPWDLANIIHVIPGVEAFRPMSEECFMVK